MIQRSTWRGRSSRSSVTLNVFVPARGLLVDGDLDRIVQVLSNLLTNAAKYTPPAGHVTLSARASDDCVIVTCEDDGPGVAAELVPRLFDLFAQGPQALDRLEGGLGLGLALARSLTELHGGTIHLETGHDHRPARSHRRTHAGFTAVRMNTNDWSLCRPQTVTGR